MEDDDDVLRIYVRMYFTIHATYFVRYMDAWMPDPSLLKQEYRVIRSEQEVMASFLSSPTNVSFHSQDGGTERGRVSRMMWVRVAGKRCSLRSIYK